MPFPDVYSNDLRKHILSFSGPAHHDPQVIALQQQINYKQPKISSLQIKGRSTILPVEYNKRRGVSAGYFILFLNKFYKRFKQLSFFYFQSKN